MAGSEHPTGAPGGETGAPGSGVLLTGVGKRYDIVSAFAQHATVLAAAPNPMVQRFMDGPEFSIDALGDPNGRCLNAIPRTMIESRGGESIKGAVIADQELVQLGARVCEALGVRGPATIQVFRDREVGLGITD